MKDAIFSTWDAGVDSQLISMATGGGKSVVFGRVGIEHLEHHRGAGPVVLLAHRKELVEQAAGHFIKAAPQLASKVEAIIGRPGNLGSARYLQAAYRWKTQDVLVTTPQTLNSDNTSRIFPDPSLVIIDEAHHYSSAMFKRVLQKLGCFSGTRTLGVTATPFREDHRDLLGVNGIFNRVSASVDISWLIGHRLDPTDPGKEIECAPGEGYLVPPKLRHLLIDGLDLSKVPTSMSSGVVDFRDAELGAAMEEAGAFEIVAKAVVSELPDGKGVIFAPTVKSSKHLAQVMNDLGATCGHLDGEMNSTERKRVLDDFRAGRTQWLSNVGIISEGFDLPEIDTVVLARPTRSRIFFRQAIGRALRPAPGKRFATVFDVAGASDGHSLAGVEALTDSDVLTAQHGESLTDLLDRSNRARRGIVDRIKAHQSEAKEKQTVGEHGVEQIVLTAEGFSDQLKGLALFADRARPLLTSLVVTCNEVVELPRTESMTMDELSRNERRAAELVKAVRQRMTPIESLKTALREALLQLKEDSEAGTNSAVTQALITGYIGTVGGSLFGDEDERPELKAPGSAQALKIRRGPKEEKPKFLARNGWALLSSKGHHYCPIHTDREVTALAISVRIDEQTYVPAVWDRTSGNVEHLSMDGTPGEGTPLRLDEQAAHLIAVNFAADYNTGISLTPSSSWRRKPASDSARAMARRTNPTFLVPDNADAGFVADVITSGQYDAVVNKLGAWVVAQLGAPVLQS